MKKIRGVWLPDGEQHFVDMLTGSAGIVVDGIATYQRKKLLRAMEFTPPEKRRRCIDVGAHVGMWAMWLVKLFREVEAFEPVAEHADIFPHNVKGDNWNLYRMALGEAAGKVAIREVPESTGSAHVCGMGDIEMRALDSFGFTEVDFIKIDVEGYELQVVKGAELTIRENRPIMVVEQKGNEIKKFGLQQRDLAVQWLTRALGMKTLDCISGDWILGW